MGSFLLRVTWCKQDWEACGHQLWYCRWLENLSPSAGMIVVPGVKVWPGGSDLAGVGHRKCPQRQPNFQTVLWLGFCTLKKNKCWGDTQSSSNIKSVQRNCKIVTSHQIIKITNGLNYLLFYLFLYHVPKYSLELYFDKKLQYIPIWSS